MLLAVFLLSFTIKFATKIQHSSFLSKFFIFLLLILMILSSTNHKRVHTIANRQTIKSHISSQCEKNYYSQASTLNGQKPLISFTSFQQYLDDSNQRDFLKKENQKFHRCNNHAKTQAYFTYQKEKNNSSQPKNQKFKSINYQESIIESFNTKENDLNNGKNIQIQLTKNVSSSKSQLKDYFIQKDQMAQSFQDQQLGAIQGWSSELKPNQNRKKFASSQNILQQRKLNSTKNHTVKCSQNPFKIQKNIKSLTQPDQKCQPKKFKRLKKNLNKQNIEIEQKQQNQDEFFNPVQISNESKSKSNALTQINQLQEEIVLSKRSQNFLTSLSVLQNKQNSFIKLQNQQTQQKSIIQMLKKEFQYLCSQDPGQQHKPYQNLGNNVIKSFIRFPNSQNKQNTTCYQFDRSFQSIGCIRPYTTKNIIARQSATIPKMLWSASKSTSTEKYLYRAKNQLKKCKKAGITTTRGHANNNEFRSISEHKQRFQISLQEQKRERNRQSCESSSFEIADSIYYPQSNLETDPNQYLEKLNILSYQLKNSQKLAAYSKTNNIGNKKLTPFNRAIKVTNRDKMFCSLKVQNKKAIQNLTITQLEGRQIQKLTKKFDFQFN